MTRATGDIEFSPAYRVQIIEQWEKYVEELRQLGAKPLVSACAHHAREYVFS